MFEGIKTKYNAIVYYMKNRIKEMRADIDNPKVTPKDMISHLFKQSSIQPGKSNDATSNQSNKSK